MDSAIWCKHYRGLMAGTCAAGVRYADVGLGPGVPGNYLKSLPCFEVNKTPAVACPQCVFPTPEEIAAEEAEDEKRFADIGTARAAIVADCGGPWKRGAPSKSGAIDCPVGKAPKALRYSRAGYNGHVHAACTTKGCVSWME